MRLVEIDREYLGGPRCQVGQRVATSGRNGDDGGTDRQLQSREIGFRVFPDLGVDQTAKPEREKTVPKRRLIIASAVADRVRDQLRAHLVSESAILSGYRRLAAVLRQWKAL